MTNSVYYTTSSTSFLNSSTLSIGSTLSFTSTGHLGIGTTIGSNGTFYTSASGASYNNSSLSVKGDLEVDGNIKVKGKDLVKILEQIENRFAIISDPTPEKIEKFEALKKAYNHYKLMEKLIGED